MTRLQSLSAFTVLVLAIAVPASASSYITVKIRGVDPTNGTLVFGTFKTAFVTTVDMCCENNGGEDSYNVFGIRYGSLRIGDVVFGSGVTGIDLPYYGVQSFSGSKGDTSFFAHLRYREGGQGFGTEFSYILHGAARSYIPIKSFSVFSATVTSVPEPDSWALMIAGFGMAGFAMRRRRVQPADLPGSRTFPVHSAA